ncbi:MAG: hypothetical protein A2X18_13620 [Bacteroidetes bacterium GWF2_40_14]|nr:MAG: hypothetical protein A2X18_13620 [Bacteroidetes bacterium GWF2_40_14]
MKNKFFKYLTLAVIVAALPACEKDPEVYNSGDGLNFYYENEADTLVSYSFVYGPSTATVDTVWVKVETIGLLSDNDRNVTFEQVQTGTNDAVAGTHYVAFNDASLKSYYVIKAGSSRVSIPVIIKRDASLKTKSVNLSIRIKSNDYFKMVNLDRNRVRLIFTDQLSKPNCWAYYCTSYFGTYGPVKHQWLIEQTGNKWDNEYLSSVLGFTSSNTSTDGTNSNYDSGYCSYLSAALTKKLNAYNAARTAQGLDILKEADGTVVSFPSY